MLCAMVENMVHQAVQSVSARDATQAAHVIDAGYRQIDDNEVDIEEACLKILALYQPVATDLRYVIAMLKINNDLERIGDEAVNIAERSGLSGQPCPHSQSLRFLLDVAKNPGDVAAKFECADGTRSRPWRAQVSAADDEVDALNRQMYLLVQQAIRRDTDHVDCLIHFLSISRHLERIADYATNISEDVIYLIEGEITRHKTEAFR